MKGLTIVLLKKVESLILLYFARFKNQLFACANNLIGKVTDRADISVICSNLLRLARGLKR